MVTLDGGDAFDISKEGDGLLDISPLGNLNGDAGNDAVVVKKLSAIFLYGLQQVLFPYLLVIHDDKIGLGDIFHIFNQPDFLAGREFVDSLLVVGFSEVDGGRQRVFRKEVTIPLQ